MPMIPSGLANAIKAKTEQINNTSALSALWTAVCEYVASNADVVYQWSAVSPEGDPDPQVTWTGKILTGGNLTLSMANTPAAALSNLSLQMNTQVMTWTVIPAPGFATAGPTITAPSINIKPSMATERDEALLSIATDIITGIKAAIPPIHSGAHGAFTGATTSGKIL